MKLIQDIAKHQQEIGIEKAKEILRYDKKVGREELHTAVATLLLISIEACDSRIRMIGGEPHVFDGFCYQCLRDQAFSEMVGAALENCCRPPHLKGDDQLLRRIKGAIATLSRNNEKFNDNPRGLNFQDGVLWMGREYIKFEEGHSPNDVFTYVMPFNYMGERVESPLWEKFINQVMPDEEFREYTMASFANAIAGDPMKAQRMLILMGVGASGKSTLIDAVCDVIGRQNTFSVDDLKNLTKDDSRYRMDLAKNVLCICGDASGNIGNKDVLKQIVGKEEISGRMLFKEIEYFKPRASLIIASNEVGFTYALGDSGISRRIDIISFNEAIAEKDRDPHIGSKLAHPDVQREMVMTMVEALVKMQNEHSKLVRPKRMDEEMLMYANDGDTLLSFFQYAGMELAGAKATTGKWIHQQELLKAFNVFCTMQGNSSMSMRNLKGKIRGKNPAQKSARGGTHRFLFKITDEAQHNRAMLV